MTNSLVCVFFDERGKELDLPVPVQIRKEDAGYDLAASETITIKPGETGEIDCHLGFVIPAGQVGIIYQRSGFGRGNLLLRGSGVIDSNYRGTVKLWFRNLAVERHEKVNVTLQRYTGDDVTIEAGQRVAQIVFIKHSSGDLIVIEQPDPGTTERGTGHSGSSGK